MKPATLMIPIVALAAVVSVTVAFHPAATMQALIALHLTDPPPRVNITDDILCDPTSENCNETTLEAAIRESLTNVASRPGSMTKLWLSGADVEDLECVATATSTSTGKGQRGREAAARRFVDGETTRLLTLAKLALSKRVPSASPIAESLTLLSWQEVQTARRRIIVLSDLRQVSKSLGDFECGSLPDTDAWLRSLTAHHYLEPGSLSGVTVHAAFLVPHPVEHRRCSVSLERESAVRELWSAAIERAGGSLLITAGPPRLEEEEDHDGD